MSYDQFKDNELAMCKIQRKDGKHNLLKRDGSLLIETWFDSIEYYSEEMINVIVDRESIWTQM